MSSIDLKKKEMEKIKIKLDILNSKIEFLEKEYKLKKQLNYKPCQLQDIELKLDVYKTQRDEILNNLKEKGDSL